MNLAPVVVFVYNRPLHTRQTLQALSENYLADQSELIVFMDGPIIDQTTEDLKNMAEVKTIVNEKKWCKSVKLIESEFNKGLKHSIIDGVSQILNEYDRVIILEDDIVTSPYFLTYMNDGLNIYENEDKVASINAYLLPLKKKINFNFFLSCGESWGWGTWRRAWNLFNADTKYLIDEITNRNLIKTFNFDNSFPYFNMLKSESNGKLNSWCIKWYASIFLQNKLTLYPKSSLVKNIGCDGSGTHFTGSDNSFDCLISKESIIFSEIPIIENYKMRKEYSRFFNKHFSRKNRFLNFYKLKIKRFFKYSQ